MVSSLSGFSSTIFFQNLQLLGRNMDTIASSGDISSPLIQVAAHPAPCMGNEV